MKSLFRNLNANITAMKVLGIIIFTLISFNLMAEEKGHLIPDKKNVLAYHGTFSNYYLPNNFTLLNWNIYKGKKVNLHQDFYRLANSSDIVTTQEFMSNIYLMDLLTSLNLFSFQEAISFIYTPEYISTGVLTGSKSKASSTRFIRTSNREPIIKTPKMTIITTYPFRNCNQTLMVVNTHAINFVRNSLFNFDIEKIAKSIKKHKGPLIWAGDFNTWNKKRIYKLKSVAKRLGLKFTKLKFAEYVKKFSGNPLDYILFKGLNFKKGEVLKDVLTSDHRPLSATFSYYCK